MIFWAIIEYGDSNTSRTFSSTGCILTTFEIVILLVISIILVKVLELLIIIIRDILIVILKMFLILAVLGIKIAIMSNNSNIDKVLRKYTSDNCNIESITKSNGESKIHVIRN